MSKKTWSTLLVVLLIVGAAIGIYFATKKPAPAPEPSPAPVVETAAPATDTPATDAPATDVPATDVPATDVPATDAPADKSEAAPAAEAVAGAVAAVGEKAAEAVDAAKEGVEAVGEKVAEAAEAVKEGAEAAVDKAAEAVDAAKDKVEEVVAGAEAKIGEAAAAVSSLAAGKEKVSVWYTFTKAQEAYLLKAISDFNASQDKVVVEGVSQPRSGFENSVYQAVNEGVGPDIIFHYPSEAVKYLPAAKLADLSQFIYDPEIGIKDFDTALAKIILDGEVKGFSDGLIHYVPAYTSGPVYTYNKALFKELGLEAPTNWEELYKVAATIFEKKGFPGMGIDGLVDTVQQLIMESPNSGYIDVANKKVLFDTPEVRKSLQQLVDAAKKGHIALKASGDYFSDDFNGGTLGSFIGSVAGVPYTKPADGSEFGIAPVPATSWYPSWNRGPIVFDYKNDARTEAAYEFVKYFISADVNAGWTEAVVALAPYQWTKDTEAYKKFIAQEGVEVEGLRAVEANLPKVGPLPNVQGAAQIRNIIADAVKKAAGGDMTFDAAWDEAVKLANEALAGN